MALRRWERFVIPTLQKEDSDSSSAPPPGRKRHWLKRMLLGIVGLLGLICLLGPRLMAPVIRHRLEAMVSKNLHARLTMDGLRDEFSSGGRGDGRARLGGREAIGKAKRGGR